MQALFLDSLPRHLKAIHTFRPRHDESHVAAQRDFGTRCLPTIRRARLQVAAGDAGLHSIAERYTITGGRVVRVGKGFVRKPPNRVDYLLRCRRGYSALVESVVRGGRCLEVSRRNESPRMPWSTK